MLANILKIWSRRLFVFVCTFSTLSAIATAVSASSGAGSVSSAASTEMQMAAKLASAAVSWPASAKNPAAVAVRLKPLLLRRLRLNIKTVDCSARPRLERKSASLETKVLYCEISATVYSWISSTRKKKSCI